VLSEGIERRPSLPANLSKEGSVVHISQRGGKSGRESELGELSKVRTLRRKRQMRGGEAAIAPIVEVREIIRKHESVGRGKKLKGDWRRTLDKLVDP